MAFREKYEEAVLTNQSYVCVGLDSDINLLPKHLLHDENPIATFNKHIIDHTCRNVAAYKLNYAFYLSEGAKGIEALHETIEYIPGFIPIIIDCKIGDIANTMVKYGEAFFREMKADAITVNPLMGEDVVTPLMSDKENFFFVLALTSNPSADNFLKRNDLYRDIAIKINEWGSEQFGAVVGATNSDQLAEMRKLMPETLFLIPGIGAQGGSLEDVMKNAIASVEEPSILINSSRGIIFKESDEDFALAAHDETERLRQAINQYL